MLELILILVSLFGVPATSTVHTSNDGNPLATPAVCIVQQGSGGGCV